MYVNVANFAKINVVKILLVPKKAVLLSVIDEMVVWQHTTEISSPGTDFPVVGKGFSPKTGCIFNNIEPS